MGIPHSDYLAMQARLSKSAGETVANDATDNEKELHREILDYCRSQRWIALHSRMDDATGRVVGEPDFLCLLPKGVTLLVECKTKTGKLSLAQQALRTWALSLGHTVHICRSLQDFLTVTIEAMKQPTKE